MPTIVPLNTGSPQTVETGWSASRDRVVCPLLRRGAARASNERAPRRANPAAPAIEPRESHSPSQAVDDAIELSACLEIKFIC